MIATEAIREAAQRAYDFQQAHGRTCTAMCTRPLYHLFLAEHEQFGFPQATTDPMKHVNYFVFMGIVFFIQNGQTKSVACIDIPVAAALVQHFRQCREKA